MDEGYDPLSHLSTALSLLPRTLAGVGFSLPVGLSEVDQMTAFFSHMDGVLKKDQKSGNESLEKSPGQNPNPIEKEGDRAGKNQFEGQQQAFLEPLQTKQQYYTRRYNSKPSPNPVTIDTYETGKSLEGKLRDVKSESSEPLPEPSISSIENNPSSEANKITVEKDETGKDRSQANNGDTNFESVIATMMEQRPSIISNAVEKSFSLIPDSTNSETGKTENISYQYCSFESGDFVEAVQRPSITTRVNNLSPNTDNVVPEKDKPGNSNFEGECNVDFRSVESMLESPPSIHSDSHNPTQVIDKMKIERDTSEKNCSHPEQMVENRSRCRRPGLGLDYNISPFTLIQKSKNYPTKLQMDWDEKAKQVVSVDFTVLDHISDPDVFSKKAYELEAAVAEIKRMGGEPKIIGERVFNTIEDDQPRRRRPGLGLQLPVFGFVLPPMRPLPAKLQCACHHRAPTESTNPEMIKAKTFSESQNEAPSSISNATKEAPEMNLYASSSTQRLLSVLESCPEDVEKAVAMIYDCLNLKRRMIPAMPKLCRVDVVKSPWRQLPSVERVRDLRGEDSLGAFEELKRRFFQKISAAYCSDDDTNSLAGIGSIRSLSTSPGCKFGFENEEIEIPYHAGPSGSPNVEIEELPSQEKVPEMISEARGVNTSDEDITDDDIPNEPEMGSPWDNSPANTEVAVSAMPLETSPVNAEDEVVRKEASSREGKKRRLEHADSSLDVNSKILTPSSDSNTETIAEASLAEPPRDVDEKVAPPKKKSRKQQKRKNSIQILEGGLQEVDGVRRSTRIRSKPLRGWMGERLLYARVGDNFPTAVGAKEFSPATVGMRVKVKSFLTEEHADFVARLAK